MSRRGPRLPTPKLDPNATSHLRPWGRAPRRGRPILELAARGRWRATAKVVPIEGMKPPADAAGDTAFDVVVGWTGPSAGGFARSPVPVDAQDSFVVWDQELAQHVARIAHELAAEHEVPFLEDIAAAVRAGGVDGWRGHYYDKIGDHGHAAAEGF